MEPSAITLAPAPENPAMSQTGLARRDSHQLVRPPRRKWGSVGGFCPDTKAAALHPASKAWPTREKLCGPVAWIGEQQ
ncbi:hypothetical protein NDU88_002233 [Pleurodeles waltl]|uniref:Uncharacterized protein n=1 Tax=Pleurodeles waltl TaxID=8319 RepID=A0AAV7Q647_PLEWA|nr:hypothetical protein NDU88_002233 [Pleurodeles waltl]